MTRQLKEEKELRWWVRRLIDNNGATKMKTEKDFIPHQKRLLILITALVRAVREDCAKVERDRFIAAAIRRK